MAEPSDLLREVADVVHETMVNPPSPAVQALTEHNHARTAEDAAVAKRARILALRIYGLTIDQIATDMKLSQSTVRGILDATLQKAERQGVNELREIENARLDRAQASVWAGVINGDDKKISTFLKISSERSKINGLYAPTKIDLAVSVRNEMEQALARLDEIVIPMLEDIEDAEIVEDDDDGFGPAGESELPAEYAGSGVPEAIGDIEASGFGDLLGRGSTAGDQPDRAADQDLPDAERPGWIG